MFPEECQDHRQLSEPWQNNITDTQCVIGHICLLMAIYLLILFDLKCIMPNRSHAGLPEYRCPPVLSRVLLVSYLGFF